MHELQCSLANVHDWLVYKLCDITKNPLDFDRNKLEPFYVKGAVLLDKPTAMTRWNENNILGIDLILFKITSLTASVMAKFLCKIPQTEKVQNVKLRMVWNIPLTIFFPSHQPAEFMAFDDDCYTQGKKGFSTHTATYKRSVIKLYKYLDSTRYWHFQFNLQ